MIVCFGTFAISVTALVKKLRKEVIEERHKTTGGKCPSAKYNILLLFWYEPTCCCYHLRENTAL